LGKKLKIGPADDSSAWLTIVGIVDDVHYGWIDKNDGPTIYRSYRQSSPYFVSLVLRTGGEPLSLVPAVRSQVAAVDPDLSLFNIKPLDKVISDSVVGIAYVAVMMGVLGIIALVLAAVGVYGVMSNAVSERTNEIGIRMALGADRAKVVQLVLRGAFTRVLIGLILGAPLAVGAGRLISAELYGVSSWDPLALTVAARALAIIVGL
jgi:ABC-type antimicrobial peptide transport system permease subunit